MYIFRLHALYFSSLDDEKQQDLVDQRRRGLPKLCSDTWLLGDLVHSININVLKLIVRISIILEY